MAKLIYLSPSNHGVGANKCLRSGCYEDKHTRPIAEAAAKYLKASGFNVIVASADKNMSARCKEANSNGAALYVPIHTNASSAPEARYLLFMCYNTTGEYKKIFDAVKPFMAQIYNGEIKLSKRRDLYEINVPNAKTFYCEMGFHTNSYDCNNFIHNPDAIGKAIAKGICQYYGVVFKDGTDIESKFDDYVRSIELVSINGLDSSYRIIYYDSPNLTSMDYANNINGETIKEYVPEYINVPLNNININVRRS